ncbi:MAG TPA: DUF6655 family protein [Verrucomicrobiae bacterium]|nr:DUF6655 family protein [Verrucomicrobiae bacterium]
MPIIAGLAAATTLAGCVTARQTDPPVTATEQLLISTAVDNAAAQLQLQFPPGSKVFVDAGYVDMDSTVIYPRYALASVRRRLLQLGAHLTTDRDKATVIVELRSGAQSVNDYRMLVGTPSFSLPVPLAGNLVIPEVPLFRLHEETGISKLALVAYDAEGRLIGEAGPHFGEARRRHWVVLFVFSRSDQNIQPDQ